MSSVHTSRTTWFTATASFGNRTIAITTSPAARFSSWKKGLGVVVGAAAVVGAGARRGRVAGGAVDHGEQGRHADARVEGRHRQAQPLQQRPRDDRLVVGAGDRCALHDVGQLHRRGQVRRRDAHGGTRRDGGDRRRRAGCRRWWPTTSVTVKRYSRSSAVRVTVSKTCSSVAGAAPSKVIVAFTASEPSALIVAATSVGLHLVGRPRGRCQAHQQGQRTEQRWPPVAGSRSLCHSHSRRRHADAGVQTSGDPRRRPRPPSCQDLTVPGQRATLTSRRGGRRKRSASEPADRWGSASRLTA